MSERERFNPFPGLRPFNNDEDYLFFGREQQTGELLALLGKHRFLSVVGTSGSGKSSLVRAGLLPELEGGTMNRAGSRWEVALLRPGGDPVQNLARALCETDLYELDEQETVPHLAATLSHSGLGLVDAARQSNLERGANLLVVVDQFEEIFRFRKTSSANEDKAAAFVNLLLEASRQTGQPIYVVLTMRSDYLGDCSEFRGLAEAVNAGEYLVPRLSRDQLQSAIQGPVKVGGGEIAFRLVQELLNDVGNDQDQLPVLQHALMRTWDYWRADHAEGEALDLCHYRSAGGIEEALSRHADEIFEELSDDRQRLVAERVFKALTERGPDNRGIRRPARLDRLGAIVDAAPEEVKAVIEAFRKPGRTFLMPMDQVELASEIVIDISHESLMRVWRRLSVWVEGESQSARIYGRLADSAALNAEGKAGLYRDPDLQIALSWRESAEPTQAWAERYHGGFSQAMAFLEASRAAKQDAEAAREEARQRELEQARKLAEAERLRAETQQRSARRLRGLVGGLAVVAALALVASMVALRARREAQENAERAKKAEIVAQDNAQDALEQADRAKRNEGLANTNAERAERQAKLAEQARQTNRRTLYASQINQAGRALATPGGMGRFFDLLSGTRPAFDETDLRGWEWYYLNAQRESPSQVLSAGRGLLCVAWSPDGKRMAYAGGGRNTITLRDVESNREIFNLVGHQEMVMALSWSADSARLASASADLTVKIWDTQSLLELESLRHGAPLAWVGWNPEDSRDLAAAARDGTVTIWDTVTGTQRHTLAGGPSQFYSCDWSPDGLRLATKGPGNTVIVWDTQSGERRMSFEAHTSDVDAIAWSPEGERIATGDEGGTLRVWSATTGREILEAIRAGERGIEALAWSPDGTSLATGTTDASLKLWDATLGTELRRLNGHREMVASVSWHPEGAQLASAGLDQTARIWDASRDEQAPVLSAASGAVQSVSWSPDGNRLASAGDDNNVLIWSTTTRKVLSTLAGHTAPVGAVAWSPDGQYVASASQDGTAVLWDPETGREHAELPGRGGPVTAVAWSGEGNSKRLAMAAERTVYVWDLTQPDRPALVSSLVGHRGEVLCLAWNPDGTRLVSAGNDGFRSNARLRIWDVQSGDQLSGIPGPLETFRSLAWSPGGRQFASASDRSSPFGLTEANIRIWDADTGQQIRTLEGHTASVRSVAWHPDVSRLVSASADRTLKLWDVDAGHELLTISGHNGPVNAAAWDAAGMRIASASEEGTIHIWDAQPGFERDLQPKLLDLLDTKVTDGRATARDFQLRAGVHARAGQWEQAAADYDRAAELMGPQSPGWFLSPLWVVGPYPRDLQTASPPEKDPDPFQPVARTVPENSPEVSDPLKWQPVVLGSDHGLDLSRLFEPYEHISCYVYARVYSPQRQQLAILVGSDDYFRLWLNGDRLHEHTFPGRTAFADQDIAPATLKAGWNTILMKVVNLAGDYALYFRLSDDPIHLAEVFRRKGQWDQLIELWNRVLERNPQQPGYLHARSRAARNAERFDAALADLTQLLDRYPDNVALLRERAEVYREKEDPQAAFKDLARAVALRPSDWHLRLDLGRVSVHLSEQTLAASGQPQTPGNEAAAFLEDPTALIGRGLAYEELGKNEAAEVDFARAIQLVEDEPDEVRQEHLRVLLGATDFYLEDGNLDSAAFTLGKALDFQPDDLALLSRRGDLHARRGLWQQAADDFARTVELGSNVPLDWFGLSPLLVKTEQHERYRRHVALARERFGAEGWLVSGRLMQMYALLPDAVEDPDPLAEEAGRYARQASNAFFRSAREASRGMFHYRAGRYAEAIDWLSQSIDPLGRSVRTRFLYFLAMAHHRAGQADQARRRLQHANFQLVNAWRPDESDDLGDDWINALSAWVVRREAEELIRGPVGAAIAEADELFALGKNADVVEKTTEALTLDANNADLIMKRAMAYERLGQDERAAADWRQLAEINTSVFTQVARARAIPLGGITVDGRLDDWPKAMFKYPVRNNPNPYGPTDLDGVDLATSADLSPYFMVGYDAEAQVIYVAVVVRDDKLVDGSTPNSSDAVEVYVDGKNSKRSVPVDWNNLPASEMPAIQYIGGPGAGSPYGGQFGGNPGMMAGDITQTLTRMAHRRTGDVIVYEWAVQAFDRFPDAPTNLAAGKRIGFDVVVVDSDSGTDTPAWICWGPSAGLKMFNASRLGELYLVPEQEAPATQANEP